ncbi:uncharacterized protein [Palaemon carinicauda]|uniref:uncharacterized protein n=1 Tax=Palaemon carinicauda TaxID=392227 RepID=UPI0035B57EED
MVTPLLCPASRAASTESLLTPSFEDDDSFRDFFPSTVTSYAMPRPLITMGESADSSDSAVMGSPYPSTALVSLNQRCSAGGAQDTNGATRSVPDIELHARENNGRPEYRGYRLLAPQVRCSCSHLPRAPSHESVRSVQGGINEVVVVAPTSYRDRIIRQHSQPETCLHCHHPKPSASLRHLPRLDSCSTSHAAGEGIATIAADTLRINGALSSFKQVSIRVCNPTAG